MATAMHEDVLDVNIDKLFVVITNYKEYPDFVTGITKVEVLEDQDSKARVKYYVSLMKEVEYVLDHVADKAAGTIKWTLVESPFFKKNEGSWQLTAAGDNQTSVKYETDTEFSFPVPGFVLRKLIKTSLPPMVRSFGKRAAQ